MIRSKRTWLLVMPLLGLFVGFTASCSGDDDLDKAMTNVTDEQLAIMVLPQVELGEDAADLPVDPSSGAGFVDNDQAAEESPDPNDTGSDLEAAGRIRAYELSYADYSRSEGALEADSGVELYRSDDDASTALDKFVSDFKEFQGPDYGQAGYYFEDVQDQAISGIGDEAVFIRAHFVVTEGGDFDGFTSATLIRLGRVLGFVSQVRGDDKDVKSTLNETARTMEQRIEDVLLGNLEATPVPIPSEEEAAAAQIRGVLDQIAQAFNTKDIDGYIGFWTDKGLQEGFGVSRQEALDFLNQSIGEPPIDFRNVSSVEFTDDGAAFDVDFVDGPIVKHSRFSIIDEGKGPQIDGVEYLTTPIPSGTTPVDLTLREFAFDFDPRPLTDGNIAFRVQNAGQQQHEIVIEKVPADLDIAQAYQEAFHANTSPAGAETVGYVSALEPGATTNVVFAEPLPAGRYALLCFVPDENDPDGAPHAFKGMIAEFTVK